MCEIEFVERYTDWAGGYVLEPTLVEACDLHLCPGFIGQPSMRYWTGPSGPREDLPAPAAVLALDRDPRGQIADLIDAWPADVFEGRLGISRGLRRWPVTPKKWRAETRARWFAGRLLLLEVNALAKRMADGQRR